MSQCTGPQSNQTANSFELLCTYCSISSLFTHLEKKICRRCRDTAIFPYSVRLVLFLFIICMFAFTSVRVSSLHWFPNQHIKYICLPDIWKLLPYLIESFFFSFLSTRCSVWHFITEEGWLVPDHALPEMKWNATTSLALARNQEAEVRRRSYSMLLQHRLNERIIWGAPRSWP